MGVYFYTIRAEKVSAQFQGELVDVHALKFLFKPIYSGYNEELARLQKMALARAENYWESRKIPRFVVEVYKGFEPGLDVIDWKGGIGFWDTDRYPGDIIGKLIIAKDNSKKGFHWEICPKA